MENKEITIKYKCINCGKEKDFDVKRDAYSCPDCGYEMYEMPYSKKIILEQKIIGFIENVFDYSFSVDNLEYELRDDQETKSPSFNDLIDFIINSDKISNFTQNTCSCLDIIIENYKNGNYVRYDVEYDDLTNKIHDKDLLLNKVVYYINNTSVLVNNSDFDFEKLKLYGKKTIKDYLLKDLIELCGLVKLLVKKYESYITINNIFNIEFKDYEFDKEFASKLSNAFENKEVLKFIQFHKESIQKVLDNEYVIDILFEEDNNSPEMLSLIWNSLYLLLCDNIYETKFYFENKNKEMIDEKTYFSNLNIILKKRFNEYLSLDSIKHNISLKNENELFETYSKIRDLDDNGYFIEKTLKESAPSESKLNSLIGLNDIKKHIKQIKAFVIKNKLSQGMNLHMCFSGNPGTGKTVVARIIADILYENNILPTNNIVEVDRAGLVAGFVGQTAIKTKEKIDEALGGVLFVDEAYSLAVGDGDYGMEAISTLIKYMEDYRGKFCVILAGYKKEMEDLINSNTGFKSRLQFFLDFPDYSTVELSMIFDKMIKEYGYYVSNTAKRKILSIIELLRKNENFANAREVRNIIERLVMIQNLRSNYIDDKEIGLVDVEEYIKDMKYNIN